MNISFDKVTQVKITDMFEEKRVITIETTYGQFEIQLKCLNGKKIPVRRIRK